MILSLIHIFIEAQKDKLVTIANALLEHETLNNEQIESLYNTGVMLEMHDGKVDDTQDHQAVSYTHLDVYKRQDYDLIIEAIRCLEEE